MRDDALTAPTGADILARALARAGATHAFGVPGGEVLALVDALDRAGVRFVLARHETAAGFMAEGLWHMTGALPVLVATLGPGVANAVNVVANAMQDRVPLILLSGCVDAELAESYTHQVFDHQALLRPLVKASFRAAPGALGPMIARAIALATEAQPGPVHIDLPISVAESPASEPDAPPLPATAAAAPALDAAFHAAARHLAAAERPLAIAGVDAVNEAAGPAIAAFCRAQGIPLLTTYKAKGLLPEDDPLSLGGAGLSPRADALILHLVRPADCILLLGYDPIEMRAGWRHPWPAAMPVIEIAEAPRHRGMHHVSHRLTGRLAPALDALAAHAPPRRRWPDAAPAATRAALADAFAPRGWGPAEIFHTLRDVLPPETVATADSGAHRILLSQIWRCPAPRALLQSAGLCTMACALPLAIGARLGRPGTPVVAILGDAGLEMAPGELATLRDLGLPLLVVVLADASLALIEMKQRAAGRPNRGVDFGVTDYPALARAFGGHGAWIDDAPGLRAEAEAALHRPGLTLLACRIPRRAYDGAI
jgi:acetolactate synthase I/II/III large subunit